MPFGREPIIGASDLLSCRASIQPVQTAAVDVQRVRCEPRRRGATAASVYAAITTPLRGLSDSWPGSRWMARP